MSNYFYGDAGDDVHGGSGNDELFKGYGGDDELSGGGGNDELVGGGGIDLLNGEAGNDTLKGGGGNDVLSGGAGNDIDILVGGKGADTLDGGEGNDIYEVSVKDLDTPLTDTYNDTGDSDGDEIDADKVLQLMLGDFDASTGIDSIRGHETNLLEIISDGHAVNWDFTGVDLEHVSQITGSAEDDVITGSDGDDKVKGGGGNDELNGGDGDDNLIGGGGDDTLEGGDGDDKLKGGGGNDTLDGGEGSDTYVLKPGLDDDGVVDSGTSGTDVVDVSAFAALELGDELIAGDMGVESFIGAEGGTEFYAGESDEGVNWDFSGATLENISQLTGSGANDFIAGSDSDDKIKGLGGVDFLSGGGGDDILKGGGGDDALVGGSLDDIIAGTDGGDDTLKGGGGNDFLVYDALDSSVDGQDGTDTLAVYFPTDDGTLDITTLAGGTLKNFEIINFLGPNGTLVLDKDSVRDLSESSDTLTVTGFAGNAVMSDFEWTQQDDADGFHIYTSGGVTLRVEDVVETDLINTQLDDDPVLTVNAGTQVDEGGSIVLTTAMLNLTDVDSLPAALVYGMNFPNPPVNGQFELLSDPGNAIASFTQAQLEAGDVVYVQTVADALSDSIVFAFDDATFSGINVSENAFEVIINADITGTVGGESINGGNGDDTLSGGGGDDILIGNYGDDTLNGGTENDTLDGGYGDDTLAGGDGNDIGHGGYGDDIVNGDDGADHLYGGEGDDILDGGAGNDTGNYSGDVLIDGLGFTVNLAVTGPQDTGAGMDTLIDIENLVGSEGNDTLSGDGAVNQLDGGVGDDALSGGGSGDLLLGKEGDDVLHGDAGSDELHGGTENDVLYGDAGADLFIGGAGVDRLYGGASNDTYIINTDTDDLIFEDVAGGTDTVQITSDELPGGTFTLADNMENGAIQGDGGFTLIGSDDANTLTSGDGDDTLMGGAGNDDLEGGQGNDILVGGAGDDILSGGPGVNTASFAGATADLVILVGASATGEGDDTLIDIHNVIGGSGNDLITGTVDVNEIHGGAGNDGLNGGIGADLLFGDAGEDSLLGGDDDDTLYGGDDYDVMNGGNGVDSLFGGNGNDLLIGAGGNDFLYGGDGIDEAAYNADTNGVTVNLADGTASGAGIGTDTLFDIENVTGGTGNDTLIGDTTDNELTGNSGEDMLIGGDGNDVLSGGDNNDVHKGGAGNDDMYGGNGVDTLDYSDAGQGVFIIVNSGTATGEGSDTFSNMERFIGSDFDLDRIVNNSGGDVYMDGGAGNDTLETAGGMDTMVGGAGDDKFLFRNGAQASNPDTIEDFEGAGATVGDIIQLYTLSSQFSSFSNGAIGAVLAAEFESGNGQSTATDADTRLIYDTSNGNLYYDADGNAGVFNPIHFATITGSPDGLTHEDFVLTNA